MGRSARRSTTATASSRAPTRWASPSPTSTATAAPTSIIANKGSNTVSILINEKVGNSFTFVPGPGLQAGDGPVATVLGNVAGSPLPDLLVADSSSNQVLLLEGIGNGFFNDQEPTIYQVGTDPSALYLGQFTGGPGQSLATINSGSNTVTLISGLGSASPAIQSISSGGLDPTAGLTVTLPGSGLESLMVANNGDGNISLLTGGASGLDLSSVVSSAGVPNPSALALSGFNGGELEFYATSEGEASATLLGFQLEESGGGIPTGSLSTVARGLCIGERLGPARLPERVVAGPGRHPVDDLAQLAVRDGGVGGGFGIGSRRVRFGPLGRPGPGPADGQPERRGRRDRRLRRDARSPRDRCIALGPLCHRRGSGAGGTARRGG